MTDTEILRDLAEFLDEATKHTPDKPSRTAAAIRRTLARVAELEAQVAAHDEAIRVLVELYMARQAACESAHGLNLFASPTVLTRLVHAREAASGNPIAIATITDAKNKEPKQ